MLNIIWYGTLAIIIVIVWLIILFLSPDDTDKGWFSRSGMSLYTDNKTGLQYIKAGFGTCLIPRLDENGNHMRKNGN